MRHLRLLIGCLLLVGLLTPLPATARPAGAGPNFPARIDLPDAFAPEGITTGTGTTLYVGSLAGGALWRGDARTGTGTVIEPAEAGRMAVGIDYDERRKLLWVAGGMTGEIRAHDARTGEVVETYAVEGSGFLNDLVVTRDAVYVTDSNVPRIVVIPLRGRTLPAPEAVELLDLEGDLVYTEGFNANGIVAARGYLVVVQSNTGNLFRVDPDTGSTTQIDLGGYSVVNGDGLELRGSTLYVVRNRDNLVAVVRLGAHLASGTVVAELTDPGFDVPTTITTAAGRLWAVNARFGTEATPDTDYWITRVPRR